MNVDRDMLLRRLSRAARKYRGLQRLRRYPLFTAVKAVNSLLWRLFNKIEKGNGAFRVRAKTFFNGAMHISVPPYQGLLLTGAYAGDDSEVRLTKFFIKNIKEGTIFFDIGANYGYYTLLAHTLTGPNGKVVAFEPSHLALPFLRKNVAGKNNVMLVEKGVSDQSGTAEFYESDLPHYACISTLAPDSLRGFPYHRAHFESIRRAVTIEIVALDLFCKENDIIPDVIKIDVEGAEEKVLRGALGLLRAHSPVITLEIFFDPMPRAYKNALEILRSNGFIAHCINDAGDLEKLEYAEIDRYGRQVLKRYRDLGMTSTYDNLVFMKEEKRRGKEELERAFGWNVNVFVPPHDAISNHGIRAVEAAGMHIIRGKGFRNFLPRPQYAIALCKMGLHRLRFPLRSRMPAYPYALDFGRHKEAYSFRLGDNNLYYLLYGLRLSAKKRGNFIITNHLAMTNERQMKNLMILIAEAKKLGFVFVKPSELFEP